MVDATATPSRFSAAGKSKKGVIQCPVETEQVRKARGPALAEAGDLAAVETNRVVAAE